MVVRTFCSSIFSICCTNSLVISLFKLSIFSTVFSGSLRPFLISWRTLVIRTSSLVDASRSTLIICRSSRMFSPRAFKAAVEGILSTLVFKPSNNNRYVEDSKCSSKGVEGLEVRVKRGALESKPSRLCQGHPRLRAFRQHDKHVSYEWPHLYPHAVPPEGEVVFER